MEDLTPAAIAGSAQQHAVEIAEHSLLWQQLTESKDNEAQGCAAAQSVHNAQMPRLPTPKASLTLAQLTQGIAGPLGERGKVPNLECGGGSCEVCCACPTWGWAAQRVREAL